MVSTGRQPVGRIERITMVQSAYDVKLLEKDFRHIQKNNYPIVIVYNGRDHFVPTITTSEKDFLAWKIHHEFGSLLAATLLISQECDRPGVPAATASSIRVVRDCLQEHLPKISKKGHTKYLTIRSKAVKIQELLQFLVLLLFLLTLHNLAFPLPHLPHLVSLVTLLHLKKKRRNLK